MSLPLAPSADLLAPAASPGPVSAAVAAYGAGAAKIHATAQAFEASFLQSVLGSMFAGDSQQASSFGGGEAEGQFRSFLTEAIAKGVTRRGGIGLAPVIERELLKLQGAAQSQPAGGAGAPGDRPPSPGTSA